MEFFLFYLFSSMLLFCSVQVVFSSKPVHSVFYLVLSFCNAAALLFLVEVEFFALLLLIVYVGAIAVLFLFIVMMLDTKEPLSLLTTGEWERYLVVGVSFAVFIVLELLLIINLTFLTSAQNKGFTEIYRNYILILDPLPNFFVFGQALFTYDFIYVLVAGLVLLVAIIGAVVLTLQQKVVGVQVQRQRVEYQLSRNLTKAVFFVNRNVHKIK